MPSDPQVDEDMIVNATNSDYSFENIKQKANRV